MVDFSSEEPKPVLFEQRGPIGVFTLNRPLQLNALTVDMVRLIRRKLEDWSLDRSVKAVVARGAGGAFCAGGDVDLSTAAAEAGAKNSGVGAYFIEAFREAYPLHSDVKRFGKPYLAFVDGVAMGAGVGLALHGDYRIGGDRLSMAMPELAIGMVPDVGASFFLPRLPHHYGLHMALTGARLDVADAINAHLVDYYVRSERMDVLLDQLVEADYADGVDDVICEILAMNASAAAAPALKHHTQEIEAAYEARSLVDLLGRLEAGSAWGREQAEIIRGKCPTAAAIAFELMSAASADVDEALVREFRAAAFLVARSDFPEGVKATLLEKRAPNWSPATLQEVTAAAIAPAFEPPSSGDLRL